MAFWKRGGDARLRLSEAVLPALERDQILKDVGAARHQLVGGQQISASRLGIPTPHLDAPQGVEDLPIATLFRDRLELLLRLVEP